MLPGLDKMRIQGVIDKINLTESAEIRRSSDLRPKLAFRVYIPLDTAATAENPYIISQPFNGFQVEDATDNGTSVKMSFGGVDKYNTDNYTTLKKNASAFSQVEVKQAVLYWSAQAGKTMTIMFYVGVDFRPGSLVSQISGGVAISWGGTVASNEMGSLGTSTTISVTTTATLILPADPDRLHAEVYVDGPLTYGDSAIVAGTRGIQIPSAGLIEWNSTAALYGIVNAGTVNAYALNFTT